MTRSRKRTPITGNTTATSEKEDKVQAHRRIRRRVVQTLCLHRDGDVLPHERELSNPWGMAKDGKGLFDPRLWPKLMRK